MRNGTECPEQCGSDNNQVQHELVSSISTRSLRLHLGPDKTTGRVKWCPDCECVKYLLLVPIILLPIIVVLILCAQMNLFTNNMEFVAIDSNVTQRHHRDYRNVNDNSRVRICTRSHHITSDSFEVDEREISHDIRTSFIPFDSSYCAFYQVNRSNEAIANDNSKSNQKHLLPESLFMENDRTPDPKVIHSRKQRNVIESQSQVNESVAEKGTDEVKARIDQPREIPAMLKTFWKGGKNRDQIRFSQVEIMKQYMDLTTDPCNDFYQFACGNWERLNKIPRDEVVYDTFEMLREILDIELNDLLAENNSGMDNKNASKTLNASDRKGAAKRSYRVVNTENTVDVTKSAPAKYKCDPRASCDNDSAEMKVRHFYKSCMDTKIRNRRGINPLKKLLKLLGGWPVLEGSAWNQSAFNWVQLAAKLRMYNNNIFFKYWIAPDIKNSDHHAIQFDEITLGLPTREYFLQAANANYVLAYKEYMARVMTLCGAREDDSVKVADEMVAFETEMASITLTPEERANISLLYQRVDVSTLHRRVPEIDWKQFLRIVLDRPVEENETIIMHAMNFMSNLVIVLNNTEPRTIANYMFWRFVSHRINNVDDRFLGAKQKFYNTLIGREESPPRWKACVNRVNSNMGMALGAIFVRKYFDEQSKEDTMNMTYELQNSFRAILNDTDWIDEHTKTLAKLKVNSMSLKIGYPDHILDATQLDAKYKALKIHPNKYFENVLNALRHLTRIERSKLSQRVNRTMWHTPPALVNAYYDRSKNQIMFPAGILQPPFFHRYFPRSLNFGGIGVVIGHELTHGFDDKGRLFDRYGNLNRWWSEMAIEGFHQRANCLITQYGNYKVNEVGGLHVNGAVTQGENIADNGGIKQAFHAYENWLRTHCQSTECIEQERLIGLNFTHKQLFFLNFAQIWCGTTRPEATKNKITTEVHSPNRFRVIGTLSNSMEFAKEFGCAVGMPMNPMKKCSVW